jgi:hydroxymethylglutaryl-CoA synthase
MDSSKGAAPVRGIVAASAYVPFRRLDRASIAEFTGAAPSKGQRSVASFDEDTTTMGFEAARRALSTTDVTLDALWFATAEPAYLEKTNATAIHAALRLDSAVPAHDAGGAVRSGIAALRSACEGNGTVAVVAAGVRTGRPNSADESAGGDGAAAVVVGDAEGSGGLIAEFIGAASETAEFIDRWREPASSLNHQWEERFGETQYLPLANAAWERALEDADLTIDDIAGVVISGVHARAAGRLGGSLGVEVLATDLAGSVGNAGAAGPAMALTAAIERAEAGAVLALVALADGVEVLLFRVTRSASGSERDPIDSQIANGGPLSYAKFLSWRGHLEVEPPNRPLPARVSASAAARSTDWKYGFVASVDRSSGAVHMPPAQVSYDGGAVNEMDERPMADTRGRIVTLTVDRLAYSPSPPIIFAVVDFEGGGRSPVELCDVDVGDVAIGDHVEMVFRRLGTADGLHNYFWKARPVRTATKDSSMTTTAGA